MADGYDRYGQENGDGGSFVMGLLTGTVLGAGLGMLFAPRAGAELRGQLSEQATNLANTASEGYKKASEVARRVTRKRAKWHRRATRRQVRPPPNGLGRAAKQAARCVTSRRLAPKVP